LTFFLYLSLSQKSYFGLKVTSHVTRPALKKLVLDLRIQQKVYLALSSVGTFRRLPIRSRDGYYRGIAIFSLYLVLSTLLGDSPGFGSDLSRLFQGTSPGGLLASWALAEIAGFQSEPIMGQGESRSVLTELPRQGEEYLLLDDGRKASLRMKGTALEVYRLVSSVPLSVFHITSRTSIGREWLALDHITYFQRHFSSDFVFRSDSPCLCG
jgi:hypothetical protein